MFYSVALKCFNNRTAKRQAKSLSLRKTNNTTHPGILHRGKMRLCHLQCAAATRSTIRFPAHTCALAILTRRDDTRCGLVVSYNDRTAALHPGERKREREKKKKRRRKLESMSLHARERGWLWEPRRVALQRFFIAICSERLLQLGEWNVRLVNGEWLLQIYAARAHVPLSVR